MATETNDYRAVLDFMERAKRNDCFVSTTGAPDELAQINIGYLSHGLSAGSEPGSVVAQTGLRAFAAGWNELEGVMVITPEPEFNADLRVTIAASNERALRDLLLSFPAGQVGFFYLASDWILKSMDEVFEGRALPAREGYYATERTFNPRAAFRTSRLTANDYPLVRARWSESVWKEILAEGYCVHACHPEGELSALCFHWEIAPWRDEIHGLQFVKDYSRPYAQSVISSATREVMESGKVATCTANLASDREALNAFRDVGYQLFYRIHSYLGIKRRRSGGKALPENAFKRSEPKTGVKAVSVPGEGRQIKGSKDPVLAGMCDLAQAGGRREHEQFLVEGVTLTRRAIDDGLPVDNLLYTSLLLKAPEGIALLNRARQAGIDHYLITDGLMGKVTTTRPVPPVAASVFARIREAARIRSTVATTILIVENVLNPDNLGMILRSADAAGVEAVVVAGEKTDPLHKNCIRAARGAVGRLPILSCPSPEDYLQQLKSAGFTTVAAAPGADRELYRCSMTRPVAIVVGNEQHGISRPALEACTTRVQIPMAPGQDSLNVGVAASLMLYEVLRQKTLAAG